jgi:tetratricopeptide (TPR) repeat protein
MGNRSDRDRPGSFNLLSNRFVVPGVVPAASNEAVACERAGWLFWGIVVLLLILALLFIAGIINGERLKEFHFDSTTYNLLNSNISASRQTCFDQSTTIDDRINSCTIAINANEKDAAVYSERGLLHGRNRDFDRAVADFNAALQEDKQNLPALLGRCRAWQATKRYLNAFKDCTEVINAASAEQAMRSEALAERGMTSLLMGVYDRALPDLNEALRLEPNSPGGLNARARARAQLHDIDGAIADYSTLLQVTPDNIGVLIARSSLFSGAGRLEEALADADNAIALDQASLEALNMRCYLQTKMGAADRGIADCDRAIKLDPSYAVAYNTKCEAWLTKLDMTRAIDDCTTAAHLAKPESDIALYSAGLIHEARGELVEASRRYKAALVVRPSFRDASEAVARVEGKITNAEHLRTASLDVSDMKRSPAVQNNSMALASSSPRMELDLLDLTIAVRVQKRLSELGFFNSTANGTWGQQSRLALARFKIANNLKHDDMFNSVTAVVLFAPSASRSDFSSQDTAPAHMHGRYKSLTGTKLNPLNPNEAVRINTRLRELGFFKGRILDIWSTASRSALQSFKTARGLAATDTWDSSTELALFASNS